MLRSPSQHRMRSFLVQEFGVERRYCKCNPPDNRIICLQLHGSSLCTNTTIVYKGARAHPQTASNTTKKILLGWIQYETFDASHPLWVMTIKRWETLPFELKINWESSSLSLNFKIKPGNCTLMFFLLNCCKPWWTRCPSQSWGSTP